MDVFPLVFRCAVVVKPKQPFIDWLHKIDPTERPGLDEILQDSHLYLVPDFEEEDEIEKAIEKYLKKNYTGIFISELDGWYTDPGMYPKMSYAIFLMWFEIETHSMIFDMVNRPITKE